MKISYDFGIQRIGQQDYYLNRSSQETRADVYNIQDIVDISYSVDELLEIAAWQNDTEAVSSLIEKGADVRTNDDSALGSAAYNGNLNIVKLLIEKGADPKKLIGTSSYNNHEHIKEYLDEIITTTK